jgi:hypothetical protein
MTVTLKVLVARKQAELAQTTQYTAPAGTKAVIDKFTVTNTSAAVATLGVNLVASGGAAADLNLILKGRAIAPSETYTCPELVGQALEAGGFISTIASAATALTISVTGREIV